VGIVPDRARDRASLSPEILQKAAGNRARFPWRSTTVTNQVVLGQQRPPRGALSRVQGDSIMKQG